MASGSLSLQGVRLLVSGSDPVPIPEAVAAAFQVGDRLIPLPTGDVLLISKEQVDLVAEVVGRAQAAFQSLSQAPAGRITEFYEQFARALEDPVIWEAVEEANRDDVARAQKAGRSTTRLVVSAKMRDAMISGLREWRDMESSVGRLVDVTRHDGWDVEHVISPLGIVAFVFEGRPNVFADATGVLRSGNVAVLRIGRDALGTAQAIVEKALAPALKKSGLPRDAVALVPSREHAAGWALFSDQRVALAIARGSGPAVQQLGAVARQAGIPASLHGKGGAWMVADASAGQERLYLAILHSLDRKVCNTLNTLCLVQDSAEAQIPVLLRALRDLNERDGKGFRLHVTPSARPFVPVDLFDQQVTVHRATGPIQEHTATDLAEEDLGLEWEWEETPELSVTVARDLAHAVAQLNRYSPQFVASFIGEDATARQFFFNAANAPFVGDGFTRWVDGQFALKQPELGLSNWQNGRLLGRSGILTGAGIFTIRLRVRQNAPNIHR